VRSRFGGHTLPGNGGAGYLLCLSTSHVLKFPASKRLLFAILLHQFFLFTMGNAQSSSGTRFIEMDSLPIVQSYKPCHIPGDSDLYGLGIWIGFYLQYFGAVIATMFGASKEFRIWRAPFVVIAAATFVALSVKVTGENLVILDWAIISSSSSYSHSTLPFPLSLAPLSSTDTSTDRRTSLEDIRAEMQSIKEDAVNDRDVAVQRAFADFVNARSLLFEHHRPAVVEEALHRYIDSFGPLEGNPSPRRDARRYLQDTYPTETQHDIGANFQLARRALAELPDQHIQALHRLGYSMEQAEEMAERVQRVTRWERRAENRLRRVRSILTHDSTTHLTANPSQALIRPVPLGGHPSSGLLANPSHTTTC